MPATTATGSGNIRVLFGSPGLPADQKNTIQVYYRGFRLSERVGGVGEYEFEWSAATEASNITSLRIVETDMIDSLDTVFNTVDPLIEVIDIGATSGS
jgi:hypothetical protein